MIVSLTNWIIGPDILNFAHKNFVGWNVNENEWNEPDEQHI